MKKLMYGICIAAAVMSLSACKGKTEGPAAESTAESAESSVSEESSQEDKETEEESNAAESLQAVYEAVKKAYGEAYLPSMEIDEQTLKELYGIPVDLYEEAIAEGPMISAHIDTFIAVKAKEGKGEEVEKLLNHYRDNLLENGVMYPQNMPIAQASQVLRFEDDVYFVMLGMSDELGQAETEEEMLAAAKNQTQIGVDAINQCYGIQ
ncbi:DUF4358 domain-containing protein [Lachnoclostridium edouardi]|uniref:DUF4358 domain-containing protein n=1 Tax=Lachnoclostridium edouardi TaxID=1926283 RepID=UPI000C7CDEF7|nr:DUF4358 domain-containing protein [Lachnoclostridium edouardi]